MKLKSVCSFLLAVILPIFLYGHAMATELSGKVTDSQSKQGVPGATVTIAQLRLTTVADVNGNYTFRSLPSKGRFLVEARSVGYKSIIKTVDVSTGGSLDFSLSPSIVETREVVITGTPITGNSKSNSTSAASVSKDQLLSASSTNLIDALSKQVPGVGQITTGGAISKPVIRGLSYNRVVTLSDGVKQEGQQWGDEHGLEIDQNQGDRVEVLRGASSLLYGSDAIGGVVNILEPLAPAEGHIKGEVLSSYATNNGLSNNSVMLTGNQGGFVWRGRASYQNAYDFKTPDGYYINSGFNNTSLSGMLGLNKSWGYSHLNFSYFKNNIGFYDSDPGDPLYTTDGTNRTLDYPRQDIRHYKLAMNNNFLIGTGSLKLDLGYQKNQRRELDSPTPALFFDLNTYSLDAKYYLPEGNGWQPIIGLSTSDEHSLNKGTEFLVPAYDQFAIGAFGYAKKTWNENNTFNLGLRYDYINNNGKAFSVDGEQKFTGFKNSFSNLSGALGYTHVFSEGLNFKANAGSAFRAPNPAELGSNGVHEGTSRYEIGNPNLSPERSYQADATLEFDAGMLNGSFGVYENYIHDYIYASAHKGDQITVINDSGNSQTFDVYRYGQVNANLYGVEGSLNLHPTKFLHLDNTYSYTHAENRSFDRPLPLIPAGVIHNTLRFEPKIKALKDFYASVGLDNYFKQYRIDDTFETPTNAYTLINAGIGATFKLGAQPLKIYVSGNNLTNKAYYDALNRLRPGRLSQEDPTYGVLNPGRNITFGFYLPLNIK
ncbi:iron complex outermembrane receptor protein [Mucilaginibacter yixingensis]|uniref:Iron complex outermembrane receptor protein n=1 Tax=Mucilaginibacter yixingensis TaxID=1295612 RepID=A0A2T5JCG5_9SPHI|nr:TonB-dependent receptor [Mucilaginibacter yixingensis]PTQ99452.1 iron complex outermembrane receptor protein [Mucilaginibacter yixingensis]